MELYKNIDEAFNSVLDLPEEEISSALANIKEWLSESRFSDYVRYIESLAKECRWEYLFDCFWRMMPFGTGGRRGAVGVGPNRINPYTIALSVQGHSDYLKSTAASKRPISVAIACDVRVFLDIRRRYPGVEGILTGLSSFRLAQLSAGIYAANGIEVYVPGTVSLDSGLVSYPQRYMSTPELSYTIRSLDCSGGLNISASHNHPDDNGCKFYNHSGGQEIPPNDERLLEVVEAVAEVKSMSAEKAVEEGFLKSVPEKVHKRYIDLNASFCHTDSRSAKIAYTPLCGVGMTTVFETLTALGFDTSLVKKQAEYDGSFSSVKYRIGNPEVPQSMDLLEKTASEGECEAGFATDPDADRLGMIVRGANGDYRFTGGNEIGTLLLQSLISKRRKGGLFTENLIFITTLVTSGLLKRIARDNGLQVIGDLMVGCKYIADAINSLELHGRFPFKGHTGDLDAVEGRLDDYLFGCEESLGYLMSPEVRDKDACGAAVHLAGLASELADDGRTMTDMLRDIYRVYGYHSNLQRSLVMEGSEGQRRMEKIQDVLRSRPPQKLAGLDVARFEDYRVKGGPVLSGTDFVSRNVLLFELNSNYRVTGCDNSEKIKVTVRPSGTEPKIKIYVEVASGRRVAKIFDDVCKDDIKRLSDPLLDEIMLKADRKADEIGNAFIRYCLGPEVLGNVYGKIPDEALQISDLVTVDNKIKLFREIMPELAGRLEKGDDVENWLDSVLAGFGEDARSLVAKGALAWINSDKFALGEREKELAASFFFK